jgi:hypothetical protein
MRPTKPPTKRHCASKQKILLRQCLMWSLYPLRMRTHLFHNISPNENFESPLRVERKSTNGRLKERSAGDNLLKQNHHFQTIAKSMSCPKNVLLIWVTIRKVYFALPKKISKSQFYYNLLLVRRRWWPDELRWFKFWEGRWKHSSQSTGKS